MICLHAPPYLDPKVHELSVRTWHLSGCPFLDRIHPVYRFPRYCFCWTTVRLNFSKSSISWCQYWQTPFSSWRFEQHKRQLNATSKCPKLNSFFVGAHSQKLLAPRKSTLTLLNSFFVGAHSQKLLAPRKSTLTMLPRSKGPEKATGVAKQEAHFRLTCALYRAR